MHLLIYLFKHTHFISYTNNHLFFELLSNFYSIITDNILFTLCTVYKLLISDYKNMSH